MINLGSWLLGNDGIMGVIMDESWVSHDHFVDGMVVTISMGLTMGKKRYERHS